MKSTQKKPNNRPDKKNKWQLPYNTQVIITPGAKKSIDDALEKGEAPRLVTDRKLPKSAVVVPAQENPATPKKPKEKEKPKEPVTLSRAVAAELKDRAKSIRLGIQINSEDIIRGVICFFLLSIFALLQTTFFARFAPFGKVPDLMLVFVIAIGVYEGEKWGAVAGLAAAFIIQALGTSGIGPELLSIVYMPVGCASGLLSKYYLRHTLPVKAMYIVAAAFIKSVITVITAFFILDASFGSIILHIAIPEYFSTVILSPIPFFFVWLAFKPFHKTRAERTDRTGA